MNLIVFSFVFFNFSGVHRQEIRFESTLGDVSFQSAFTSKSTMETLEQTFWNLTIKAPERSHWKGRFISGFQCYIYVGWSRGWYINGIGLTHLPSSLAQSVI